MKFIALKTKDGESKGEIAFCYRTLRVSRRGFYQYLANKNRPWKYQPLADAMLYSGSIVKTKIYDFYNELI